MNDAPFQPEAVVRTGRGALIVAMFGTGWLGWGLSVAKAFNGFTAPAFGFVTLLLIACSIYVIHKGRLLRKKYPAIMDSSGGQRILKQYFLIVLIEILAIAIVSIVASRLDRSDLAADLCAMIVGIHFLPLAKIFRAPNLAVLGYLIVLWSALCWVLFRSNALTISVSLGTGILLWGASVAALLRARRIAHALRAS
jgi:hypothetical protein